MPGVDEADMVAQLVLGMGGDKQLGAVAPAFQPGATGFNPLELSNGLFGQQGAAQQLNNTGIDGLFGGNLLEQLIGKPQERDEELAAQVTAQDNGALGTTQEFQNPLDQGVLDSLQEPGNETGFGGFFGNLDQNLQSPSKLLGLGLLSQIDPRLAQAGLFAGGLFGKNKLFGG